MLMCILQLASVQQWIPHKNSVHQNCSRHSALQGRLLLNVSAASSQETERDDDDC